MRKLIGLGIIEETPDRITLQCSVDPRKFQLDMLLRRLSIISLTIIKEALQALLDSNTSFAEDAIKREDEADSMYLLAMRLLVTAQRRREVADEIGLTDPLHILYFGLMLDLAHDLVLKSVDCFFIGDIKIANSLLEMLTFVELERDRLMQELPDIPYLRLICWNITRIADNGASIALTAINNTLERKTKICSKSWSTRFK
jgi:phosphate uptake regulator